MLWSRLDRMRARLLAARERRVRPGLDDKVLTSWNGLMLRSLALGYDLTGEERYRQAAEKAASFLLATMRRDGRLQHSYHRGKTLPQAFLEDYSFLTVGLLELHRVTGAERWLKESEALARTMIADFWDEEGSTFFATPHHHEGGHGGPPLLARLKNAEDGATPSGQSMAALALIRLSRLTGDRDLRAKAQRLLNTYAGMMKQVPAAMPTMLLAAHQYLVRDAAPAIVQNTGQGREGRVRVTLAGIPASVRSGQTFEVAVRLAIPQGWHVNAARPTESWLIGTRVELAPGPFRLVSVTYPPPEPVRLGFSEKPIAVYTGSPTIRLRLQALPGVERAKTLRLRLRYQACNDRACQSPVEALLTGAIPSPRR